MRKPSNTSRPKSKKKARKKKTHSDMTRSKSPNNCCVYSCRIFLSNSLIAFIYKYYMYSLLFFTLYITSHFYHSTKNIYTNITDKIAIISVVFYGGYQFWMKCHHINMVYQYIVATMVVILFLCVLFLYFYGYMFQKYCFCKNKNIADEYHSLLHYASSVGHHIIIFL